jgi:hypothetical protein
MDFTLLDLRIMLTGTIDLAPLLAYWRYQGARPKIQFGGFFGSCIFRGRLKKLCGVLSMVYCL